MNAFLYGLALQWKLDLRSKTLLITCYLVPLLFFVMMGGIFTTILPGAEETLLPAMTVFGGTMGALIGLPPSPGGNLRQRYPKGLPGQRGSSVSGVGAHQFVRLSPSVFDEHPPLPPGSSFV